MIEVPCMECTQFSFGGKCKLCGELICIECIKRHLNVCLKNSKEKEEKT